MKRILQSLLCLLTALAISAGLAEEQEAWRRILFRNEKEHTIELT